MNINLIAPLNHLGYGVAGQNIAYSLHDAGANVSLFPIGGVDVDDGRKTTVARLTSQAADYDPTAPSLRIWQQFDLGEHVGKYLHVGFPFFELDTFNHRERSHISRMDRLFVASEWAKRIVEDGRAHHDVRVVPLGVDRDVFNETVKADRLESDYTVFVNIGKWEVRKGHDFLIKAFNAAFKKTDKVALKMLCFNPFIGHNNDEWAKLYLGSTMGSKISLVPRLTSQRMVSKLIMASDCGVFPARAEGWNFELLETMSMGKHVIASNCTAHTQYANADNARLIEMGPPEPAQDGVWFHGQGDWASLGDDQLEQTVHHMREIHRLKQSGGLGRNEAGVETAKFYSWRRTADAILKHLG